MRSKSLQESGKRAKELVRGQNGGAKSAQKRGAEAKAMAEKIRDRWPLRQYKTTALLAEADQLINFKQRMRRRALR